jgi:hypothetical protein
MIVATSLALTSLLPERSMSPVSRKPYHGTADPAMFLMCSTQGVYRR